jgi:hypothetical protein
MNKAFIDTTILTDALIKSGEVKRLALDALKHFDVTELPVFAIKEFKAGPLKNFVWMHNKLVIVGSYEIALDVLHRMSRTPRRYTTSTAIEALREAAGSISKQTPLDLVRKYGEIASMDKILCDEFRLAIKTAIMKAWKRRRKVTTNVVLPLPCYRETSPYEKRGLIELDPQKCAPQTECSLAPLLRAKLKELEKMRDAIKNSEKLENQRRAKTLHEICRKPKTLVQEKDCQNLGDAIFVVFAPIDSIILTSNIADYKPLAEALGKVAKRPDELKE